MRMNKKFLALFLAVAFIFAMIPTMVSAANNANLTVDFEASNVTAAKSSLKAYKIMNVVKTGDKYVYGSVNSTIDAVINTALYGDDAISAPFYPAFQDKLGSFNETECRTFAKLLAKNVASFGEPATATVSGNTAVFEGLADGYYLIVDDSATVEATTFPILFSFLGSEGQGATIYVKALLPLIKKEVSNTEDGPYGDQINASVGDDVYYKISGPVVPDEDTLDNYEEFEYTIKDQIPDGVTYDPDSLKVTVGDTVLDPEDYTIDEDGSIIIDVKQLVEDGVVEPGDEIVITYKGTLDEDAIDDVLGNPSDVTLEYNNDPANPDSVKEAISDPVRVFTFNIDVFKVDENNNALTGAGFTLLSENKEVLAEVAVDENGIASFDGYAAGTYFLRETTTPDGYKAIVEDIKIVVTATGKVVGYDLAGTAQIGNNNATDMTLVDELTVATTIQNVPGQLLPITGGAGTIMFLVVGSSLIALAVVLLIKKNRAAKTEA